MTTAVRRALVALLALLGALAMVLAHAAEAAAESTSLTWSISNPYVHPDSPIVLSGSKADDASLLVELRPPAGGGWQSVATSCTGLAPGSARWSCSIPAPGGEHHKGDHHLQITQIAVDGQRTVQTGHVVVMPPAAKKPLEPAQPPPPPAPTPATPTPTARPAPSIPPSDPPRSAPPLATAPPVTVPRASPPAVRPPAVQPAVRTVAQTPAGEVGRQLPTLSETEPVRALGERTAQKPVVEAPRSDPATPSALQGLTSWRDLWANPMAVGAAALMGLLYLLLVSIPAEILNSTLESNAHRWKHLLDWARPVTARLAAVGTTLRRWGVSGPLVVVATAVAFGFADPDFGFDLTSLRLVISLAIGLMLVVHLPNHITAAVMGSRFHVPAAIITHPGAILFAVAGVLASRALGFSPGLLVGLVIGLQLAGDARATDERRAILVRMVSTYAIAIAAWAGYSWLEWVMVDGPTTGAGVVGVFLAETLSAVVIEGLTGLVVALLPLMFLDGRTLLDQSRRLWSALAVPIAFTFCLIVLPTVDALDDDAPLLTWVGVFLGFAVTVAVVWLAFRVLDIRDSSRDAADSADSEGAERPEPSRSGAGGS